MKPNLLDVLIVLVILAVGAVGYYYFIAQAEEYVYIEMRVNNQPVGEKVSRTISYNMPIWLAENIRVGDKDIQGGKVLAEIAEVRAIPISDTGRQIEIVAQILVNRRETSLLGVNSAADIFFKGRKVKTNSVIEIETEKASFSATVTKVMGTLPVSREVEKIVEVKLRNQPLFIAEGLRSGMGETDSEGKKLAEITDMEFTATGKTSTNITLRAKISASQRGNQIFFKDNVIALGRTIKIKTTAVELEGEITKVLEPKEYNQLISGSTNNKACGTKANQ